MSIEIKPVIAVVAFNRPIALGRLLRSLANAEYPFVPILYISLEGGASDSVIKIAEEFQSPKIETRIIRHRNRLGLRNHILKCGDLSVEHGAVIVFEDDLYVDRYFYYYAQAAINYYHNDEKVAGIALYSQEYNEYAGLPFKPMKNGYATYPMQVPCSWGQCWDSKQWTAFKNWYETINDGVVQKVCELPNAVKAWPESSWKKYFAAYLVCKKKYFIYPYDSYTTNCSDAGGTHIKQGTSLHQVAMSVGNRPIPAFTFCSTEKMEVSYDAYMEQSGDFISESLLIKREDIAVDLYGLKDSRDLISRTYVLSQKKCGHPYRSFPRAFRPMERNILCALSKEDNEGLIFLYRTQEFMQSEKRSMGIDALTYYAGFPFSKKLILRLLIALITNALHDLWRGKRG